MSVVYKSRLPEFFFRKINPKTNKTYTLRDIAEIGGISHQAVSNAWMNKDYTFKALKLKTARRFAKYFKVNWYDVIEEVEE